MDKHFLKLFLILVLIVCGFYIKPTVAEDHGGSLLTAITNNQPKDVKNTIGFSNTDDNILSGIPPEIIKKFLYRHGEQLGKNQSKNISKNNSKSHNGRKINITNSQVPEVMQSQKKEKQSSKSNYIGYFVIGTVGFVLALIFVLVCYLNYVSNFGNSEQNPPAPEPVVAFQNDRANPQTVVQMPGEM